MFEPKFSMARLYGMKTVPVAVQSSSDHSAAAEAIAADSVAVEDVTMAAATGAVAMPEPMEQEAVGVRPTRLKSRRHNGGRDKRILPGSCWRGC